MDYDSVLNMEPYGLEKIEKERFLTGILSKLTMHHYKTCSAYQKIMDAEKFDAGRINTYYDIPFLPVRMFKEYELKSIQSDEVQKIMTSSGTTGQNVSKIYLDKATSARQTKVLTKIVSSYIGTKRLPMIIIDSSQVLKDRTMFSARGAGILGFSIFAKDRFFALDENMQLDIAGLKNFLEKHKEEKILVFGFTFMIWKHFYYELLQSDYHPDMSLAVMIHGGGWKKLFSESVTSDEFHGRLKQICGLSRIHDYYGMVEQTGSIYMECECGRMHTSVFSDVIVRRPFDFSVADYGEEGMIEVVSVLPFSYPGHVLLTEDIGVILGEDDCPCGRKGKYFKINGRVKNAELRGCSDTYAAGFK